MKQKQISLTKEEALKENPAEVKTSAKTKKKSKRKDITTGDKVEKPNAGKEQRPKTQDAPAARPRTKNAAAAAAPVAKPMAQKAQKEDKKNAEAKVVPIEETKDANNESLKENV